MAHVVDLTAWVEDDLAQLPDDGRQAVMEAIATALVQPAEWPTPGSFGLTCCEGPQAWVLFAACQDGIEVYDFGWVPAHAARPLADREPVGSLSHHFQPEEPDRNGFSPA